MRQIDSKIYIALGAALALSLLYLLSPILTPFIIGAFLAYLFDPLVRKLKQHHVPHYVSISIVFFFFFLILLALLLLLIPLVESQVQHFAEIIPNTIDWLQNTILPWLKDNLGIDSEAINVASIKKLLADNVTKAGGAATIAVQAVVTSGFKIIEWIIKLILIPVVAFYLMCDWDRFLRGIQNLIPRNTEPTFTRLMKECNSVLGAFLRGQLIVMISLGVIYAAGLTLIGLQVGIIIGVIAGLLSIVPYLGTITGVLIAMVAAYLQMGTLKAVALVLLVFAVGHLIDHLFLTPKLVGGRIGLHPVAVIFAILAGGCLFGFVGVLLALPVASVIMVWLRYLHKRYYKSDLYHS